MSDVTPRTFDLAAVLAGRSYPEVEVPFYLDEISALKLTRAETTLARLEALRNDVEAARTEAEIETLKKSIKDSRYVYHLHGISNKARQDIFRKATEKYPRERDFLGTVQENDDRDELFTALLWQAMTTRIESPDGSVQENLTLDQVISFREMLPTAAISAIQDGVNELSAGAKAGFESAVQDEDFLSRP